MSYWCQICFKQLPGDDLYSFLQKFKAEVIAHIPEIAENNASFSPLFKEHSWTDDFEPSKELRKATENWAKLSLFRYRFFYSKDLHLLGMYSVDDSIHGLFDCAHEFQNSCDQDYDFDTWHGVDFFQEVAKKWQEASDEKVKSWYKEEYEEEWVPGHGSGLDYYRRSAAYREIWERFQHTLDCDDDVVYLSLFGFYDFEAMLQFYACTLDAVNKKILKWTEEFSKKGNINGEKNS